MRLELRFTHSNVSLEGPKIIGDISPSSKAPKRYRFCQFFECLTSDISFESVRVSIPDLCTLYYVVHLLSLCAIGAIYVSNVSVEGPKIICDITQSLRASKSITK